ncbi:hypothetical protein T440DRAFT_381623, partial [Plenodomus tracheiphilus IPT5]
SPAWGNTVSSIHRLQNLELVLEIFTVKKAQLDAVVECAKIWRFPIADSRQVLL